MTPSRLTIYPMLASDLLFPVVKENQFQTLLPIDPLPCSLQPEAIPLILSQVYEQGFKAIVSNIRRNTQSPASAMKSLNYLDNLLARREAKLAGADEAILLNEQGFLAEGSTSNIFSDIGQYPAYSRARIAGFCRNYPGGVLELASTLGIEARERKITLEELLQADEAFLTNSLIEIMPLTQVSGQNIGSGKPGVQTRKLMAAYKEQVESNRD